MNNQILAHSLVGPINATERNLQSNNNLGDAEIEGSGNGDKSTPGLDILSDLVNSTTPGFDAIESNCQDLTNYIRLEFIHQDKHELPCTEKVIDVDKVTSKIILEYVHGGLRLIKPNTIQEELLSREQNEDGKNY